jgi:hypothetical protein
VANPAERMSSISSMMADLIGNMSDLDDAIRVIHTEVYFSLTPLYGTIKKPLMQARARSRRKTYVCHVSTRRTLTLSTLLTLCSRRTTRKFQYGVFSKQNRGFLKDQEVRANVEHPFVVGHLQSSVSLASGS